MRPVSPSEIRDDLAQFLRETEAEEIVIIRNEKSAELLIGFVSEEELQG